ncbi:MAG: hypothetical protein D4S01_10215 [Dehalococcoidia bacterium]|nr:MAG: hypothetical protein D4S01_10215 [Dehalococcoidia bacterium]
MPEEKIVYDAGEHAANQKNADKNVTEKDIVYPQLTKATEPTKAKKKNVKDVVDAKAHAKNGANVETDEPVTEFKTKVNKYGFLHVPKKTWSSLPFVLEKPLIARIEGNHLIIAAATKSQPEEPRPSA